MKKFTYLLFLAIGVTACSVESMDSNENLLTADMKIKIQQVEKSMTLMESEICEGEAPVFVFNFPQDTKGNGDPKDTDVHIQVYNTVIADWESLKKLSYAGAGPEEYTYEDEVIAIGTYDFRASIGAGGFVYYDTLEVISCATCEDSLEVNFVCGETKTATFTFTAVEAGAIVIQGGLTNGTTILNASSNVLTLNTTHPGGGNSNANVTRWEGDVYACEVVTITIEFEGGTGIGDWSAKRGEEVLGSTDAQSCTE